MSTQLQTLKQSNPNGIVNAPKGSIFTRSGDKFFLVNNGVRNDLNVTKKTFAAEYKNEIWYPTLTSDSIAFETTGETWLKTEGSGKTGWVKTSSKTSIAQKTKLPAVSDVTYVCAGDSSTYFLISNGELWGVGADWSGQLGGGNYAYYVTESVLLSNVKKVSSHTDGAYAAVALQNDGTVWFAGENYDGQFGNGEYGDSGGYWITSSFQGDITGSGAIIDIAMGAYYTALMTEDRRVWMSTDYMPNIDTTIFIPVADNVKSMYAGGYNFYYIKNDDSLWGFGYNWDGELGNGTTDEVSYDNPYKIDNKVKFVAGMPYHTLYIKNDNTLWGMGSNYHGQTQYVLSPIRISADVKTAGGGLETSFFVKTNEMLYGTGWNHYGQMGINSFEESIHTPTIIDADVEMVTGGYGHGLYIKTDKTLWGMGADWSFQLGPVGSLSMYYSDTNLWSFGKLMDVTYNSFVTYLNGKFFVGGYNGDYYNPIQKILYSEDGINWTYANTSGRGKVVSIAYGNGVYVAVAVGVFMWGRFDEISISTDGINWTPVTERAYFDPYAFLGKVTFGGGKFIAGSTANNLGYSKQKIMTSSDGLNWKTDTGSIDFYCSFGGVFGIAYGNGKYVAAMSRKPECHPTHRHFYSFTQSFDGNTADDIAMCNDALIVLKDGNLYTCGNGGQSIGQTYYTDLYFTQIPNISGVKKISSGGDFFTFIKNDDTLWGIGSNSSGQLGFSPDISASVSFPILIDTNVSSSFSHQHAGILLYIKNDGTLWGTGNNDRGELGTSSLYGIVTQSVKLDDDVKHVAVSNFIIYIKNDNTLWGMGANGVGELGMEPSGDITTPTQITNNVKYCSANNAASYHVKEDGTLLSYGFNPYGVLGYVDGAGPAVTSSVEYVSEGNSYHALIRCEDGKTYGFGNNDSGQTGVGYRSEGYGYDTGLYSPILTNLVNPKRIITNGVQSFAITDDGKIYVCGVDLENFGFGYTQDWGMYSTDGDTWHSSSVVNYDYKNVAYGNGRFVKTTSGYQNGNLNRGKMVASSADGINWDYSYFVTGSNTIGANAMKFDGTNFVIFAYNSATKTHLFYKSTDGISWEPYLKEITAPHSWVDFDYGEGKYVTVANYWPDNVYTPAKVYPPIV